MIDIREHGIGVSKGKNIKSIQKLRVTLENVTTGTITISPVDITKTIIKVNGFLNFGSLRDSTVTFKLINSTTIQYKSYSSKLNRDFSIDVIEFDNVKSLQTGELRIYGSLANAQVPINEVKLDKSIVFYTMRSESPQTNPTIPFIVAIPQISGTTLKFDRGTTDSDAYICWQLIEFT